MMINRPSILIFAINPDSKLLKEILAGIEEEGVLYDIIKESGKDLDTLAYEAAGESVLGAGIGILEHRLALTLRNMPKGNNVFQIEKPSLGQGRNLGANAARAVKRMPFKEL